MEAEQRRSDAVGQKRGTDMAIGDSSAARRKLDEACFAMADGHEIVKIECDAMELLLDDTGADARAIQQAHHRVRAAGMRAIGLTTAYLSELNTYLSEQGRVAA
jgi:hypothetical protein